VPGPTGSVGWFSVRDYGAVGDGTTNDSAAVQAALNAAAATNGVLFFPYGNFVLSTGLTWLWTQGSLTVIAYGAVIRYTGSGDGFTMTTDTVVPDYTLAVFGGTWLGTASTRSMFRLVDVVGATFRDVRVELLTNGTCFWAQNIKWWCERLSFLSTNVRNCKRAFLFDDASKTTGTTSFGRTVIRELWLQGGVPGTPLIDMTPTAALYDSKFDGIYGNVENGVTVMKLTGFMESSELGLFGIEAPVVGTPGHYFTVDALDGPRPYMSVEPALHTNMTLFDVPYYNTTNEVFSKWVFRSGITADNSIVQNSGIDIEGRRTAPVTDPINPTIYVSGATGHPVPYDNFGHLIIQPGAFRRIYLADHAGNLVITVGGDNSRLGFFGSDGEIKRTAFGGTVEGGLATLLNALVAYGLITSTVPDAATLTAELEEHIRDVVGSILQAGAGVTITPNDAANTITISAP
jgi:hypothetical protein